MSHTGPFFNSSKALMIKFQKENLNLKGLPVIKYLCINILVGLVGLWYLMPLQQYFRYIVAVSFIGGGNWSTRRKPIYSKLNKTRDLSRNYTADIWCMTLVTLLNYELTCLMSWQLVLGIFMSALSTRILLLCVL